jgi:hypothetical protein
MKTTLFVLCFLCATAALGQSAGGGSALSSEPRVIEFPSHLGHASQRPMALEQNLLEKSSYVYAHGERPLWEVAPVTNAMPLGDVARILRKEHETTKKADFVREN